MRRRVFFTTSVPAAVMAHLFPREFVVASALCEATWRPLLLEHPPYRSAACSLLLLPLPIVGRGPG